MSVTESGGVSGDSGASGVSVSHPSVAAANKGWGNAILRPSKDGKGRARSSHGVVFSSVAAKLRDSPAAISIDLTQGAYPGIVILMECVPGPSLMRLGVLPT